MNQHYKADYLSPIGVIEITGNEHAVVAIRFIDREKPVAHQEMPPFMKTCMTELDEYFKGKRTTFTFPTDQEGTPFQIKVWSELTKVPFSHTATYKEIAENIGHPKAMRAVGRTNGLNPLSIVVPCHRIIGTNAKLTGYAGGLWRKEWLLEHEKTMNRMSQDLSNCKESVVNCGRDEEK